MARDIEKTILARRSNAPVAWLDEWRVSPATIALFLEVKRLRGECERSQLHVLTLLHALVPGASAEQRAAVISLRRDLYNDRPTRGAHAFLPAAAANALASLTAERQRCRAQAQESEQAFAHDMRRIRGSLRQRVLDERFEKAVQLSSPDLMRQVHRYVDAGVCHPLAKSQRHAETTAMNYLARMLTKPSPFGQFTCILAGVWSNATAAGGQPPRSTVRLNRALVASYERALEGLEAVRPHLILDRNSSAVVSDNAVEFLARPQDSTPDAFLRERICRIRWTPMVRAVWSQLDAPSAYGRVRDRLASSGHSPAEITALLDALIERGLLSIGFGIPEVSAEFLAQLVGRLTAMPSLRARAVGTQLDGVASLVSAIGCATASERQGHIRILRERLGAIEMDLGVSVLSQTAAKALVYEDVVVPGLSFTLSAEQWGPSLGDLRSFQRVLPLFDGQIVEQQRLLELFVERFGASSGPQHVLDVYRAVRAAAGHHAFPDESNRNIDSLRRAQRGFASHVLGCAPASSASELELDRRWLDDFVGHAAAAIPRWHSVGHMCQLLPRESRMVWNRAAAGFGLAFARFCKALDGVGHDRWLTDRLRSELPAPPCNTRYADIAASFALNINLRRPLLADVIRYPGTAREASEDAYRSVHDVGDLRVLLDGQSQRLRLWSEKHAVFLEPVPQGLLFPLAGPPFYRFLCQFAQARGVTLSLWESCLEDAPALSAGQVRHLPRIVLGSLIVERESWLVPAGALLAAAAMGSDCATWSSLLDWRTSLGLPSRCFVRELRPAAFGPRGTNRAAAWLGYVRGARLRKPLLVDWENPISVRAFLLRLDAGSECLLFQECLPTADDVGPEGCTTEYVIEVDE